MSISSCRRRTRGVAGAHDRQILADAHNGTCRDFLRRHELEAKAAATGDARTRERFAACLVDRAADTRNLWLAIDHVARDGGPAVGWDGLKLDKLNSWDRWELARVLSNSIRSLTYRPGPERIVNVPKTSREGTRPIVILSQIDRAVQRAKLQVVEPYLDPLLLSCSMGYRGFSREETVAQAEIQTLADGRTIWLAEDVCNAFEVIPLARLWDVVRRYLHDERITQLIRQIAGRPRPRGIRQGGALSSLLLNLYLHHHIDWHWMRTYPQIPMLRVADDLLVMLTPQEDATRARENLAHRLRSCGMPGKGLHAVDLARKPVEWMGFRIELRNGGLWYTPRARAWNSLEDGLDAALDMPDPVHATEQVIRQWTTQLGPVKEGEIGNGVAPRVLQALRQRGMEDAARPGDILDWHEAGRQKWEHARREAYVEYHRGVADGSADQPSAAIAAQVAEPQRVQRAFELFTDGSALPRSRVGGWAFLLCEASSGERREECDSHPRTTNNRMELMAVLRGLEAVPFPSRVRIVTDSRYVQHTIRSLELIDDDPRSIRRTKHRRLIRRIARVAAMHEVTCDWVRAHRGNPGNEYVDALAREAAMRHVETSEHPTIHAPCCTG